ncbi:MAG TPA: penicillin acylase family protein, partial [Ohtaekwangia sp.]|nr:penicillin acylase family protein [Ohtaekwangia sp.]
VLAGSQKITVADMMKLQCDNYNLKAAESLPAFLTHLDSSTFTSEERRAFEVLKAWDYINDSDSEAASFYESWWDHLMPMIWDEMEREDTVLSRPTTFTTIRLIKEKPDLRFFDNKTSTEKELAGDIIRKAFTLGVNAIEKWKNEPGENGAARDTAKWADYKDTYIRHLLRVEPLNIHVTAGGNHDIVNALTQNHGPSWRMVTSLEKDGVKAWAVYPGGQSGNPGSRHYADMLEKWTAGKYYPLLFLRDPALGSRLNNVQLIPAQP